MGRKWANIVAKKTAKDGANSKVYAKFGVEIYVAAKKGDPDPESNSALKFVIDRANKPKCQNTLSIKRLIKPKETQTKPLQKDVTKVLGQMALC